MARGEGVKKLSDLVDVYKKKLFAPQGIVIQTCVEVLEDLFNTAIVKEKITYNTHTRTLTLRFSGPLKTEVLLRKKEILAHIQARLAGKNPPTEII